MSDGIARRGLLLVLSSPSGGGKTSIGRALRVTDPNLGLSISLTTRPPRAGEVDGKDYHFVDDAAFDAALREGRLIEHAEVFGARYGTPRAPVEQALAEGRDLLFDIDWQGTRQLRGALPEDVVSVFILPPSMAELERRLRARRLDDEATVARRMARAAAEIGHWDEYGYVVVNRDFDLSVAAVRSILAAERLKRTRQTGLAHFVAGLLA
ncbi:guanylate kinase [Elioraea sp. Yellowstone]|uniref:guanylate kinase n=1 Tax=Elioraea sp. Yellowstone TaxID=2592070 RepID=UPI001151FE04|nr:guanylate kinase [Elioraea sp. Yellowstone]TQF77253.1 guanylate kinase [Elioraea sp. Yellowstone]